MSRRLFAQTATGIVVRVIRHGHTVNGNPIMPIVLNEGADRSPSVYRISSDAGLVYGIENHEWRDTPHVFDLTGAGRISGYTRTIAEHEAAS